MSGNFQVSNSFLQFQISFKIVSKSSFKFALIGGNAFFYTYVLKNFSTYKILGSHENAR